MAQIVIPDETLLRAPGLWVPGRKPVGPVKIDWSHPLAKNLVHFCIYQNGVPFDLAANLLLAKGSGILSGVGGSDETRGYTNLTYVKGSSYTDANSNIELPAYDVTTWDGVTCAAFVAHSNTVSDNAGIITYVPSGGYYGNFALLRSGGSGFSWFGGNNTNAANRGTPNTTENTLTFVAGVFQHQVINRIYTEYNISYEYSPNLLSDDAAATNDFSGSLPEHYIGYYSRSGGRSHTLPIYLTAIWSSVKSQEELVIFKKDPYQFLVPA